MSDSAPTLPPAIATWIDAQCRQDLTTMRGQLAEHVRLVEPLTDGFAFEGRDEVMAVFAVGFEVITPGDRPLITGAGHEWVTRSASTLRDRHLEEVSWIHLDDAGLIDHITLYTRPSMLAISLSPPMGMALNRRGVMGKPALRDLLPLLLYLGVPPAAKYLDWVERHAMPRMKH